VGAVMSDDLNSALDFINLVDSAIPTGPQKMLAQFNAVSGAYITCISLAPLEYLNTDNFKYVEVEIDTITQKIVGVYDNFKVVNYADEPTVIYESKINDLCRTKIYKRFEPEVQLDILRDVVTQLCEKVGFEHEALLDMNDYIDGVKRANKVLKQAYIDNPDFKFITIKEQAAIEEAKLDGGLHELMGPKNLIEQGLLVQ
jgi:hypothetical protein